MRQELVRQELIQPRLGTAARPARARAGRRAPRLLSVAAGVIAALMLLPLAYLVLRAASIGPAQAAELLFTPRVAQVTGGSASVLHARNLRCTGGRPQ